MTPSDRPGFRSSRACTLGLAVVSLAIGVAYAWLMAFSRNISLDEGYLMITVRGFIEGHPLYDSVFTQYGPFYYAYEWLLHAGLAVPLTHDATRLLCVMHWMAAAVMLGLAGRRMTRSNLFGILVFMQAVVHLAAISHEPGHPQEIIAGLLAAGVLLAAGNSDNARLGGLAVITALLALIKINVGILFGLPLFLTFLFTTRSRLSRPPWTGLITIGCLALPFILMRRHLNLEWCRNYSLIATCAILASMAGAIRAARREGGGGVGLSGESFDLSRFFRLAACFLVPLVAFLSMALLAGSSLRGLLDGLLLIPLKTPEVALLPIALPKEVLLNAGAALAFALSYAARPAWFRGKLLMTGLKGLFGLAGTFWMVTEPRLQLGFLIPWAWLVMVPTEQNIQPARFPRLFLCLLTVWQALQAYPIGGTQVTIATFTLVLVYVLCLHDAVQSLHGNFAVSDRFQRGATPSALRLLRIMLGVALVYFFANIWCELPQLRRNFASMPRLDLPGASLVRDAPEAVELYRAVSRYLAAESDTFTCYPGVNSLYFWSGKRPPTQFNCTGWGLLSHGQQERIFAALRQATHPRMVLLSPFPPSWKNDPPPPIAPLVRFVNDECHEIKRIGSYTILALRGRD